MTVIVVRKFRMKPVVVDAVLWDGSRKNAEAIAWGERAITYVPGRPATLHSLACRCDGRGMVPGPRGFDGPAVTCPETEPTGAVTPRLDIATPEGVMSASPGDWIIKNAAGELSPCKPDIFAATYEIDVN